MLRTQVAMGDLQSQLEALRTVTQELQEENEQKTIALQVKSIHFILMLYPMEYKIYIHVLNLIQWFGSELI